VEHRSGLMTTLNGNQRLSNAGTESASGSGVGKWPWTEWTRCTRNARIAERNLPRAEITYRSGDITLRATGKPPARGKRLSLMLG
jgi:hypothetical protein